MSGPSSEGDGSPPARASEASSTLSGAATLPLRVSPLSARDTEVAPLAGSSPAPRLVDARAEPISAIDDGSRYALASVLGEGGMGEVRLCHDRRIGREVAMKIAKSSAGSHPDLVARFLREVRVQGQLEHPGVVPVYDLGVDGEGRTVFTMKRVRGRTLEDLIERLARGEEAVLARLSRRQLLGAFSRACLTIAFAHSRGVVHRDLKPANLMLGDYGEVYVLDWGIAKVSTDAPELAAPESSVGREPAGPVMDDPTVGRTEAGSLLGTPGYMAPEQARGDVDDVGPAADLYALGCILFELLALSPLHHGSRVTELVVSTLKGADARPSVRAPDASIPPELDAICVRATAMEPADRFRSARELSDVLDRFLDGERDVERRRELAADHARAAREALADGSPEAQREAVRELGQALALDPTHQEALGTLRGMLLSPVEPLPPEAEKELLQVDRRDRARAATRIGLTVLAFPFGAPLMVWLGVRNVALFGVLLAISLAQAAYALVMGLTENAEPRFMRWFIALAFAANGTTVVLFGPYVLGPVLTVLTAATFLVSLRPNAITRRFILLASVVSVLAPILVDWVWLRSTSFEGGDLRVAPFLVALPELPTRLTLLLVNVGLVIAANYLVGMAVGRIVELERRNFGQTWRLRHLLPESVAAPPSSKAARSKIRGSRPSGSPADPKASGRGSATRPSA